ncbi:MAG TPA: diaminopimelate decarboxylase [Patescibacteria group bacterium]|nr:diaminopimelate decarboxylase [Patescibacteria group bacterium]
MNEALLREAAERWGTPLYVTDLDAAAAAAHAWRDALPGALVAYAVKANPDPALLRRLADDGFGFEVVGPIELALARRAGAPPERIVVNGVGQTDADLADALATGALVNAESLGALDALLRAGPGRIGLRINPALDAATHPHLATGAATSKFGIALADVSEAMRRLRSMDRPLASIGAHIGSDIGELGAYVRLAELLRELAGRTGAERIDLGGGYRGDPARWAAAVGRELRDPRRLIVEPGRSIVAGAGWLLTRVVRVQPRGHLVADAGMTELIRPMLYGVRHPVHLLAAGGSLEGAGPWTLAGPICEAGDLLADGLDLGPDAGEGALLAIGDAGAYGLAMASSYNGRLRPAQVVLEGGVARLSRRRQTWEDVIARDV